MFHSVVSSPGVNETEEPREEREEEKTLRTLGTIGLLDGKNPSLNT